MYEDFEQLCKSRGVTAYKVCKDLGISQGTISNWKSRGNDLSTSILKKIADYFGVSMEVLMNKYPSNAYERISELCKQNNTTITGLEKELGFAKGYICKIDGHDIGYERLKKIADKFDVSVEYLKYGTVKKCNNRKASYQKFEILCAKNNVNPNKVSKETGISTATLTSWKQGKYTPKINKLKLISDYFGVGIDYFIQGNNVDVLPELSNEELKLLSQFRKIDDIKKKMIWIILSS